MAYFRAHNAVNTAATEMERDMARTEKRKATQVLQHAQRKERGRQVELKQAKSRRRVDWNVAVF
jgi:hypothetical protein